MGGVIYNLFFSLLKKIQVDTFAILTWEQHPTKMIPLPSPDFNARLFWFISCANLLNILTGIVEWIPEGYQCPVKRLDATCK